ncbi:Rrf2 family transcriptional regulator [Paenalcaligenes niemegkensis]|uniref:Rrf2 family transcriptional regulator n=1 Tax=Paenalcaligenes niemegkensis TaxID=2895469 RepID=UPI001EE99D3A|nr:Rrf2 family transcriptional regulator [Paenalcaligenes niemegkensis]MCQ9617221.1 Rrf2 family transcriptional regulator [Paenalcaligenes niemegkensis]
MRLNLSSDYALRLLMYLASNPERLCTISEVAEHYAISRTHLMKLTNGLAQHGWILTVRGKNGGMKLAKAANKICIASVILDCEADFQLVECMGNASTCMLDGSCRLKGVLHGAMQSFIQHLRQYTLADLVTPATARVLFQSEY